MLTIAALLLMTPPLSAAFERLYSSAASASMLAGDAVPPVLDWGRGASPAAAAYYRGWGAQLTGFRLQEMDELTQFEVNSVLAGHGHGAGLSVSTFGARLYRESEARLTYGVQILPRRVAVGVGVRYLNLYIEDNTWESAWGLDAAVLLRLAAFCEAGLFLENLNWPLLDSEALGLYPAAHLGVAFNLEEHWRLQLELTGQPHYRRAVIGAGQSITLLPWLDIRCGVLSSPFSGAAGLRLRLWAGEINYSMVLDESPSFTHIVSVTFRENGQPHQQTNASRRPQTDTASDRPQTVNINTAGAAELRTTLRLSATKAAAVVAYRQTVGYYQTPEQLLNIRGIGPAWLKTHQGRLRFGRHALRGGARWLHHVGMTDLLRVGLSPLAANSVISERRQRRCFTSLHELRGLPHLTPAAFRKIEREYARHE